MKNTDIRAEAQTAGVKLWQVAEALRINDGNLSRKLRHELPETEKARIREIIKKIKEGEK